MTLDSEASRRLEQSVLGAILLDNSTLALLPTLESDDFLHAPNRVVWQAMRDLEAAKSPIDISTLGGEIERQEKFEAIGGFAYLGVLALNVPTVENALDYARRVREAGLARRVMVACSEVIELVKKDPQDGSTAMSELLQRIAALSAEQPAETSTVWQVVQRRLRQFEAMERDREAGGLSISGAPTGVAVLDEKLGGWQYGIASIIAARPGHGKSSAAMATADACTAAGLGVHMFSLEDTEESYADRVISRASSVPAENIRNRDLTKEQIVGMNAGFSNLRKRSNWIIDPRSALTADEIVRSVRRKLKENGTKVAIVDYVQLISHGDRGRKGESTHEALTRIITTLADAAKQDRIAYVVLSQLSRKVEERTDKRPQLSDLRESGSLEERAKCVVGLYRGSMYGEAIKGIDYEDGEPQPDKYEFARTVKLLVLKNSNGRTGEVNATWTGPTMEIR